MFGLPRDIGVSSTGLEQRVQDAGARVSEQRLGRGVRAMGHVQTLLDGRRLPERR